MGRLLAARLNCGFLDADDFHPAENIARMKAGIPLDDAAREGWLVALGQELAAREDVVLACSALKWIYREKLRAAAPSLNFILLEPPLDLLQQRISQRAGHFMPPSLLDSQLATLEHGEDFRVIQSAGSPGEVVEIILSLPGIS